MAKSKKTSKTRQKFDFGMEPKITTLLPTCFWIIAIHSVCCCSLPVWRRRFLKKGTPRDLFLPRPWSAPGRICPKNNNTCKEPWVLHPYKVSSKSIKRFWRRSWKCESLRTDGRRTDGQTDDGRTDDGRCAMTIAHLSLWLRWAKNQCQRSSKYELNIQNVIHKNEQFYKLANDYESQTKFDFCLWQWITITTKFWYC